MSKAKFRDVPRVVCCAIPIHRPTGKVLIITSRKHKDKWVVPKGGYEDVDKTFETAACREAFEEAGVRGKVTRFVATVPTANAIIHVYELDVSSLDEDWMERHERSREWVDYGEALRRMAWKPELVQALTMSTIATRR